MPSKRVLEREENYEREFNWLAAAELYEQKLQSNKLHGLKAADLLAKIGFCYSRASTQVEEREEFRKLMKRAVDSYEKAAQQLVPEEPETEGRKNHCKAIAQYLQSWLAEGSIEKREALDKCWSFGSRSLKAYRNAGDNSSFGRASNDTLMCLVEKQLISSDSSEMEKIAEEGMKIARASIDILTKLDDKFELIRAYFMASLQCWSAHLWKPESKEIKETSLRYAKEALEISEEVGEPYYSAMSHWAASLCKLLFTEEAQSAQIHAKKMLEYAKTTKDNYLKGVAFYILAFNSDWLAIREANPENRKERYEEVIKYSREATKNLGPILQHFYIAETSLFHAEAYSRMASDFAVDLAEKNSMLEKAIEIGRKGLENAKLSGSPDATGSTLHALSKALHFSANLESNNDKKAKLLEEALRYRTEYIDIVEKSFPANNWIRGVGKNYEGLIRAGLSKIQADKEARITILKNAISNMEDGLEHCETHISSHPIPTLFVAVAGFEDSLGELLNELHSLTEENDLLTKAIIIYENAAKNYEKADMSSRVAESYWRRAHNQDILGEYSKAATDFDTAFKMYETVAQKMPQFADFYQDYITYMRAWSEIEKGKLAHKEKEYSIARDHYKISADLLSQSKLWGYLSSNFNAWASLENAEDLSRNEKSSMAMEAFKKAVELFSESRGFLRVELSRIGRLDEKKLAEKLAKVSETRENYCRGRITLEEARVFDKKGNHEASAERYELAAQTFQQVMKDSTEKSHHELKQLVYLCQAWNKMMIAETKASPAIYGEAAELFNQAKEYALDESTSFLALANSSFCKALEAGTEFEITRDKKSYLDAKRYLETAASYYLRADFTMASAYAEATQRLFDAYVFMDGAKTETDPDKETRYYAMAEKVLRASAEAFKTAQHLEKIEMVEQLLSRVKKEKELALSLSEVLHAPTATSSTESFASIAPKEEQAVGLERFEHAEIQAKIIQNLKEAKIGEILSLEMQIVNVGKESVLLDKIEEIIPEGFEPVKVPEFCQIAGSNLKTKGKKLDPMKTQEIVISFKPVRKGSFTIAPKIVCIDQSGIQIDRGPQPIMFQIIEAALPGRIATGYGDLDNLLLGGIPENYAVVLASPSCDERDLLIRKFLEAGIKDGQLTFYVTIEATMIKDLAEKFQSNFYVFVCNPKADTMLKSQPNVYKLKGTENLTDISIALSSAFRQLDANQKTKRRACVEIISDVLLQHRAVVTRNWLAGLVPDFRSKGFVTLGVINPMMHPSEDVHAIVGLFDGEIRIYQKDPQISQRKFIRVEKMYNQKYIDSELPLKKENLEV